MKRKIVDIIVSVFIFIIGVFLLFWLTKLSLIATFILGLIFCLYGLLLVIDFYKYIPRSNLSFLIGILSLIIGVIIFFKTNSILEIIPLVTGIFIIICGLSFIIEALDTHGINYKINMGLSFSEIIIGVICLIMMFIMPSIILEFMGVLLIVSSVINTINVVLIPRY